MMKRNLLECMLQALFRKQILLVHGQGGRLDLAVRLYYFQFLFIHRIKEYP